MTGANRGLGKAFVEALVDAGATVYAGARDPGSVTTAGVTAVRLDVTDPASVAAAAAELGDVNDLRSLLSALRHLDAVFDAYRVTPG